MSDKQTKPGFGGLMIAAPSSGSGKTVITLALLRAMQNAGIRVCSAKAGPDYIDPVFHAFASGTNCINLDPWAMNDVRLRQLAYRQNVHGTLLLLESMMGLFDGAADGSGSGAELAKLLNIPVVLVVDAAKQSHSVAALIKGFSEFDPELEVAGVILNKVGSDRHEELLRSALPDVEILGIVRREKKLELPERHLGLVQAGENSELEEFIEHAAVIIGDSCNLERIAELANCVHNDLDQQSGDQPVPPLGQSIAVARDLAFSFTYTHLLEDWRRQGAELSFFSPLANEGPSSNADAVYLPGGYPELFAEQISSADVFIGEMIKAKAQNCLIYGECGGYMVLGEGLVDAEGRHHKMLGFLDLETSFEKRKLHLGYRKLTAENSFFAGKQLMAHEFHYTSVVRQEGKSLFECEDALGRKLEPQGLIRDRVMGSYMHLIDAGAGNE